MQVSELHQQINEMGLIAQESHTPIKIGRTGVLSHAIPQPLTHSWNKNEQCSNRAGIKMNSAVTEQCITSLSHSMVQIPQQICLKENVEKKSFLVLLHL